MSDQVKKEKKYVKKGLRISLLLIILCLSLFSYQQVVLNNSIAQRSYQINEMLLREQADLLKYRKEELTFVKNKLLQTDIMLSELQQENERLRENLKVIDKLALMEKTITLLEERNQTLIDQMDRLNRDPDFSTKITSKEEGEEYLSKYLQYVQQIKGQIKKVKVEKRREQIAYQKEQDRIKLLVGNNGFVVRNGQVAPMAISYSQASPNVKVDVQFVK